MRLLNSCESYQDYVEKISSFVTNEGPFEMVAKNCFENIKDDRIQAKVIAALNAIDGVAGETNNMDNAIRSKLRPFLEVGVLLGAFTEDTRKLTKEEIALLARNTQINPLEESTEKEMIDILTNRRLLAAVSISRDSTEPPALMHPALFFKIKEHYKARSESLKDAKERETFAEEMIERMKNNTISVGVPSFIKHVLGEMQANNEKGERRAV